MVLTVVEHVEHPFAKGDLTSDGVQWSAEETTSTDDYEAVEEVTVNPPALGAVIEFEFGLTGAVKSSGATESVKFKWQVRNKGGTWVDLHGEVTYAANASFSSLIMLSVSLPKSCHIFPLPPCASKGV